MLAFAERLLALRKTRVLSRGAICHQHAESAISSADMLKARKSAMPATASERYHAMKERSVTQRDASATERDDARYYR